jgi:hypothetical protein
MNEPTKREIELRDLFRSGRGDAADIAAYREELLAASAQSAEPQEAETLIDIRHRLYAEERSGGWSKWTPNEAFKTGFESGIDATFYALRARLASKPSREEALARYMKIRDEAQENPVCPSREEEMREALKRIAKYADFESWRNLSTRGTGSTDHFMIIASTARAALAQGGARDEAQGQMNK